MPVLKNLNLATFSQRPKLPNPRVIPNNSAEFERVVENETRMADAEIAVTDEILNTTPGGVGASVDSPGREENISDENEKLSRLVDDDFPFDDSQIEAVGGMIQQQYACLIGAAGTGKTTLEKKFVDMLSDGLEQVDVSQYWKRGVEQEDDGYEIPERLIPSILMCSFTGRSTQMTKKNFPPEWHPNIMTIHRALGFYPEFFQDVDEASGELIRKRRFVPAYTADNLMPWDVIIIDEAGMLGLDLWHQLWAAIKPGARVYMIGDINQLPPTHGKPILGFALAKWPTWELTHVHRQQGSNNSIVDNAHRILKGLRPVGDSPKQLSIVPTPGEKDPKKKMLPMLETLQFMTNNQDWRFLTVDVDAEHKVAAIRIRQMLKLLNGKIYDPNRDAVITPINGFEHSQDGYAIGQQPMNQELVTLLNTTSARYLIDAGRERKNFAVGDKVMATKNDYEAGVTNGMTGIVISIEENGGYIGDTRRFGLISEVNEYYEGLVDEDDSDVEFSLEEMVADSSATYEEAKRREKKESGPASHIVSVKFGEGDHAFTIDFASKSAVESLILAYVATCHKMQGGECPLVFVICHQSTKRPLNREWLYTAVTRGSQKVVLLQTRQGVGFAVGKQNIKGATLKAKIQSFAELLKIGLLGPTVNVKLPHPRSLVTDIAIQQPSMMERLNEEAEQEIEREAEPARREEPEAPPAPRVEIHVHVHAAARDRPEQDPVQVVDGGVLTPQPARDVAPAKPRLNLGNLARTHKIEAAPVRNYLIQQQIAIESGPRLVSQMGALRMLHKLTEPRPLLLTYMETPDGAVSSDSRPVPVNRLAAMLARQRA